MTPTDRSMPAVRITSVCAMPRMAMMVTCWTISDRLNGAKKRLPASADELKLAFDDRRLALDRRRDLDLDQTRQRHGERRDADQQHDERHHRRIGVQEMLEAAQQGRPVFLEDAASCCAPARAFS